MSLKMVSEKNKNSKFSLNWSKLNLCLYLSMMNIFGKSKDFYYLNFEVIYFNLYLVHCTVLCYNYCLIYRVLEYGTKQTAMV